MLPPWISSHLVDHHLSQSYLLMSLVRIGDLDQQFSSLVGLLFKIQILGRVIANDKYYCDGLVCWLNNSNIYDQWKIQRDSIWDSVWIFVGQRSLLKLHAPSSSNFRHALFIFQMEYALDGQPSHHMNGLKKHWQQHYMHRYVHEIFWTSQEILVLVLQSTFFLIVQKSYYITGSIEIPLVYLVSLQLEK